MVSCLYILTGRTGIRAETTYMNRTTSIIAVIGLMVTLQSHASMTIKFNDYSRPADVAEGGGPFNVTLKGSDSFNGINLNAGTGLTYTTFCIEYTEHFTFGSTYSAKLNSGSVAGGAGGAQNGFDPISVGTAWLYRQWTDGKINASLGSDVQKAIWALENEQPDNYLFGTIRSLLEAQFLTTDISVFRKDATVGEFGVYALNVNDGYTRAQDQLVAVPVAVPEPSTMAAGALLLLPFGVGILRSLRRNKIG